MVLELAGPIFSADFLFLDATKEFMFVSLSSNGASPVLDVFERSLSIFTALLFKMKLHLKSQIEVMMKEILLNILDMPTSSSQHKWITLVLFERICKDKQLLMDFFVNYDWYFALLPI